jgi:D-alanyl-D-alanine carboxypeptidase
MNRNLGLVIIAVILMISLSCETGNNKDPSMESYVVDQIDSIGHTYFNRGGVKGMAIAVAREGRVVYNRGFGTIDSSSTIPVIEENFFLMASISKLVCAVMILKLVEEQQLTLDQTLFELLPDFPRKDQAKKINLIHLLSHTSGLKDYAGVIDSVYTLTGVNPTKTDFYHFFKTNELDFEPGHHFNYSNSGFLLAAMIIENVTGNSFDRELDRIINHPSGLDLKRIEERGSDTRTSSIFQFTDSALIFQPHWTWIKGDGGLTATSHDLVLFPYYWSNGTIISNESFEKMCTPVKLSDGMNTGYGLGVRTGKFEGEYCIGHTGGNRTTMAVMRYYPRIETSVVVMVNTDNSPADALIIEGFVSLAVLNKSQPELEKIEINEFDPSPYLGMYTSTPNMYYGTGDISIVTYENDPHIYRKTEPSVNKGTKLYFLGNHTFAYDSFPMDRLIFEPDTSGTIVGFNTYWNGLRKGRLFKSIER